MAKKVKLMAWMREVTGYSAKSMNFILQVPFALVVFLWWVIMLGGVFVSSWLAVLWFRFVYNTLLTMGNKDFPELIHHLLHSIELLFLIPLPAIVGKVVYVSTGKYLKFGIPDGPFKFSPEEDISMAKRLVLGILVTVAGTRMLDDFLHGTNDLYFYGAGAILIISMALYVAIALREHQHQPAPHPAQAQGLNPPPNAVQLPPPQEHGMHPLSESGNGPRAEASPQPASQRN